jgi:hypothetical protein
MFSQKDRDDGGGCLVSTKTMIIARGRNAAPQQGAVFVYSIDNSNQKQ